MIWAHACSVRTGRSFGLVENQVPENRSFIAVLMNALIQAKVEPADFEAAALVKFARTDVMALRLQHDSGHPSVFGPPLGLFDQFAAYSMPSKLLVYRYVFN